MKKIFIVFLFFGNLLQIFGQANFEAKDRERIANNKAKRQIQWEYDNINGVRSTNGYKCSSTVYDTNGNAIEISNYDAKGEITSVLVYTFDNKNNKTSYSRYKGNKKELTYSQNIKYDTMGYKMVESGYNGSSKFNNTFTYDEKGRVAEIKYTTDKTLTEKRVFNYIRNTTEMSIVSPADVVLSREISIFDNRNNVLEETKYIQDNVEQKHNYSYDPTGKKIEEIKQNLGMLAYRKTYVYNPKGSILQITEEKEGVKPFVSYQYKYDSNENVIEEKWVKGPSGEYSKKSHNYDAKGLLIDTEFYNATYKFTIIYRYTYSYF